MNLHDCEDFRRNAVMRIPLKTAVLAAILLLFITRPMPAGAQEQPKPRTNVLFIFCDDHAYQAVGAYGFGLNQTPNIDRVAADGMRFTRCLTTNSLCGPSRATLLTGKYSHLNGFYNNTNSRFDGAQVTFPKLLQKAGYQTAVIGKWHLETDPTGFDFWEILPGQGQYYNPPMILNGQKVKKEGYVTDIITDDTLDWLKNKRDKSKPFVMLCHHKAPHREWEPALKNLALYDGVKFPEPPTLFDDYSGRGKAEHEQDMMIASTMTNRDLKLTPPPTLNAEQRKVWDAYYEPRNAEFRKQNLQGKELVQWKYQRYLHEYFATIASVDESVGRLLDYLKEAGLDQNTLVVYSSDQGFYLGEHGWFDKRWIFEESLRTPLLVRWPGVVKPGTINGDIVSNLDFAETILDAAGVAAPPQMQGRSLIPILKGQTPPDWRKGFYYHYYEHPGPHNVAKQYGLVTDRYKLVHFYEPELNYWELFDLKTDPHELKSVYDDPAYKDVQKELHQQLDALRKDLKVPAKDAPETIIGPRRGGPKAERGKPLNAWVLEYKFDKSAGQQVPDASGKNNPGLPKGIAIADGRNKSSAAKFDGRAYIDVHKSPSLNPAVGAWTVEATFKSDKPEGVILAQGGAANGYVLWLEGGQLRFTVVGGTQPTQVKSTMAVTGQWVTVRAGYDDNSIWLSVNGENPVKSQLTQPIERYPADGLQIGADLGSQILGDEHPYFTGLVESVRLFSGKEPD
jgi:arylsulfatase A-like enzyme